MQENSRKFISSSASRENIFFPRLSIMSDIHSCRAEKKKGKQNPGKFEEIYEFPQFRGASVSAALISEAQYNARTPAAPLCRTVPIIEGFVPHRKSKNTKENQRKCIINSSPVSRENTFPRFFASFCFASFQRKTTSSSLEESCFPKFQVKTVSPILEEFCFASFEKQK